MKNFDSNINAKPETRLGTNQSGMRAFNEKLVLTILRKSGALPKAEIAKITGLSAQTVSVIMRALEEDELLIKCDPLRGKVGQPSVPISLNPEGAYFFGLKIGRRSAEIILIDFQGGVQDHMRLAYQLPNADEIFKFVKESVSRLRSALRPDLQRRIAGMGIASPFEMWNWATMIGAAPDAMSHWKERDLCRELGEHFDFPIYLQNDATSACGAELTFGTRDLPSSFLYFYVGYFVGGGVVLNNLLHTGTQGNAGAIGSMPVIDKNGHIVQLLETSSLAGLESGLKVQGHETEFLWKFATSWDLPSEIWGNWLENCATGIAQAAISASAVIDFEALVVDASMPQEQRAQLIEKLRSAYMKLPKSGLAEMKILEGSIGVTARPLGAASLPLAQKFLVDF